MRFVEFCSFTLRLRREMRKLLLFFAMQCFVGSSYASNAIIDSFKLGNPRFPAGIIALEAYPHWKVVVIGPIPTVIGAVKFSQHGSSATAPALKIVAIITDDSAVHPLMIANRDYNEISSDPSNKLRGEKLLMTPKSTAQEYAQECLTTFGLQISDMIVLPQEQWQIRNSLASQLASVAVVWPPYLHLAQNEAGQAKTLACASAPNFKVQTFVVTRAELLDETNQTQLDANRKAIAEVVAKALRAWSLSKTNLAEAARRLKRTYAEENIIVTEAQAAAELETRRPPDLEGQRALFKATAGGSAPLAKTLEPIIDFMVATGTLQPSQKPRASDLLDPSILELIANTPELAAIAHGQPAP